MSAATGNLYNVGQRLIKDVSLPVKASTHIYLGTIVAVDASGYLVPASDTAGLVVVGVAVQEVNNTGSSGGVSCRIMPNNVVGAYQLNAVSPAITWVGKLLYASDDNTVALVGTTTNDIVVGRCLSVDVTGVNGLVTVNMEDRFTAA